MAHEFSTPVTLALQTASAQAVRLVDACASVSVASINVSLRRRPTYFRLGKPPRVL